LQDEKQPVLVTVDQQGNVFLTLGKSPREQVDDDTLVKDVSAFVKQDPKVSVMLGGDKRVDYGRVNQVLGLLQQAGVAKVGLMSQPETTVVPASHGKR
jgi:biopolymer transport protein TolR